MCFSGVGFADEKRVQTRNEKARTQKRESKKLKTTSGLAYFSLTTTVLTVKRVDYFCWIIRSWSR